MKLFYWLTKDSVLRIVLALPVVWGCADQLAVAALTRGSGGGAKVVKVDPRVEAKKIEIRDRIAAGLAKFHESKVSLYGQEKKQ